MRDGVRRVGVNRRAERLVRQPRVALGGVQHPRVVQRLREGRVQRARRAVTLQRALEVILFPQDDAEVIPRLGAPRVELQRRLVRDDRAVRLPGLRLRDAQVIHRLRRIRRVRQRALVLANRAVQIAPRLHRVRAIDQGDRDVPPPERVVRVDRQAPLVRRDGAVDVAREAQQDARVAVRLRVRGIERRRLGVPRRRLVDATQLPVQNPEVIPSRGVRLVHRGRLLVQRDRPDRVPAQLRLGPQIRQRRRQRAPQLRVRRRARERQLKRLRRLLRRAPLLVQPPQRFQRADVRRVVAKALGERRERAAKVAERVQTRAPRAPPRQRVGRRDRADVAERRRVVRASVDDRGVVVPARAVDEQQRPDAVEHGERVGGAARRAERLGHAEQPSRLADRRRRP